MQMAFETDSEAKDNHVGIELGSNVRNQKHYQLDVLGYHLVEFKYFSIPFDQIGVKIFPHPFFVRIFSRTKDAFQKV